MDGTYGDMPMDMYYGYGSGVGMGSGDMNDDLGVSFVGPSSTGTCAGACGGYGGGCWCDSLCTGYGDCCADFVTDCPACAAASKKKPTGEKTVRKSKALSKAAVDVRSRIAAKKVVAQKAKA